MQAGWLVVLALSVSSAVSVQAEACNGAIKAVTVTTSGGVLHSNGYPDHYENSDTCAWQLSTVSSSQVVQVETLDIDLERRDFKCLDYIAAYDGDNDQAPLLKKWCGTEKEIVHSTGQTLYLKFVSSRAVTRKGFALAYHSITPYDLSCEEGSVKTLSVGTTPVLYYFDHGKINGRLCQWRFDAEGSQRLALTVVRTRGSLSSRDGEYFALHDGVDRSAPEVLRWMRGINPPFSAFYPTGSALMVISTTRSTNFKLYLKVQARPAQEECNGTHMPMFELRWDTAPLILGFPYTTNSGGVSCPVHFSSLGGDGFRIDVLTENNQQASCSSSPVSAYKDSKVNPDKVLNVECWRNTRPMYLTWAQKITVDPVPGTTSVVEVIPVGYECDGSVYDVTTYRSLAFERSIPRDDLGKFSNFCVTRFLFTASKEGDHPRILFTGSGPHTVSNVLTIYDGNSTQDPVVFELNVTSIFQKMFVGPGPEMLVEFSADGLGSIGYITMKYSSSPVTDICEERNIKLTATSTPQNLTSINYPGYFPVDFTCIYKISTPVEGQVVHMTVLVNDFGYACGDKLLVLDVNSNGLRKKLGMVCGGNANGLTQFESESNTLTLDFRSDDSGYAGDGWVVQYYSASPTPSPQGGEDKDHTAAIVGAVLGVIIVVLIIALIYCFVKSRRSGSAPI